MIRRLFLLFSFLASGFLFSSCTSSEIGQGAGFESYNPAGHTSGFYDPYWGGGVHLGVGFY